MGAFTWDLGSVSGVASIDKLMRATVADVQPTGFTLDPRRTAPRQVTVAGREVVEAFFTFGTAAGGRATGVVRLQPADGVLRAFVLLTRLEEIGDTLAYGPGNRPKGVGFDRSGGQTWREARHARSTYADRDPEVIVVGGGHHGLFAAVNLQRLGADVLVVDRFPRVGDNWRTRYESLALHNLTDMCHFTGMPFPDSFPEYLPKDVLANWFEAYVQTMQVNYWTSTEFLGGEYDDASGLWRVAIRQADGSDRVMRPRHVIVATGGVGGRPNIPHLDGIDEFRGAVMHSKDFRSGGDYAGKRVLVVGVGTSGHDTARDLYLQGAEPVLLQRSPVTVVNMETANRCYPPAYFDGTPLDEADLKSMSGFIYPLLRAGMRQLGQMSKDADREMLEALERAGLRIEDDEDGWVWKLYSRFSGYYINVGASELIIEGKIPVRQQSDLEGFRRRGCEIRGQGGELRRRRPGHWLPEPAARDRGPFRAGGRREGRPSRRVRRGRGAPQRFQADPPAGPLVHHVRHHLRPGAVGPHGCHDQGRSRRPRARKPPRVHRHKRRHPLLAHAPSLSRKCVLRAEIQKPTGEVPWASPEAQIVERILHDQRPA